MSDSGPIRRDEDAPRWLLIVIVSVLLAAVFYALVWMHSLPDMEHLIGAPPVLGHQRPLVDVDRILDERKPANLIGRDVALEGVRVGQVVGDFTFWVGGPEDGAIPVVLFGELTDRQPPYEADLAEGDDVRIFGVVRDMRDFTAFGTDPLLSESARARIHRYPIFISAKRVLKR